MADEEKEITKDSTPEPTKKVDVNKINITTEVPNLDLFEEPAETNTGAGGNLVNMPTANTTTPTTETIKSGDATLNLGPKTPVVSQASVHDTQPVLPPPAYMLGGQGDADIVDFPTGGDKGGGNNGGGGNNTPPPPIGDDPGAPAGGGKSDFDFKIPTSVLNGNNEAIADWGIDVLDQLVLGWMRDRPSVSKSDVYAALIKNRTREDIKKGILRKIDEWNKYVNDKIAFDRDERDALVGCLLEIIKGNAQIAETLTPEVRAGIMVVLIMFKKYKDSSKEMPTGLDLLTQIRDEIKNAPKEHVKMEKDKPAA